jgi:cytochrome c
MISPANVSPPYFTTGFPYRKDEYLSYAASCWATIALLSGMPATSSTPPPAPVAEPLPINPAGAMRAALFGTVERLSSYSQTDLQVGVATPNGTTILMAAAPDADKVRLLLARGADATFRSPAGTDAATAAASAQQAPQFGQPISPADLAPWDIEILPSGAGLPPGSGTVAQGEAVYAAKCQACHGEKGAGQPNDRLVGGQGTLVGDQLPVKTVGSYWPYATTLFDYVRRSMPWTAPRSIPRSLESTPALLIQLLVAEQVKACLPHLPRRGRSSGRR